MPDTQHANVYLHTQALCIPYIDLWYYLQDIHGHSQPRGTNNNLPLRSSTTALARGTAERKPWAGVLASSLFDRLTAIRLPSHLTFRATIHYLPFTVALAS